MKADRDSAEMLAALGMGAVDELFEDIPGSVRAGLDPDMLGDGMDDLALEEYVSGILARNRHLGEITSFLGGGAYDFYVPAAVQSVVSRSEFLTSYTPYQPEMSQGLLQALFEYQSMMAELTGMEVVNNSLYDYASGLGEAVTMAARLARRRRKFLVPDTMPYSRMSVLRNYCAGPGIVLESYAHDPETGMADIGDLESRVDDDTIGALVESPNYFGVLEGHAGELREVLAGRVMVAGVSALSLAVVRPPGDYGADIVVTEGQVLGNDVNFGGPMLGILACRKEHVRKMPGRVIGMTRDADGRRAFCMTLQTREQHIRREKATSNICSNEALTAVAAAAYLAYMGGSGLRQMAIGLMEKARLLAEAVNSARGFGAPAFTGPYFNEFTASCPVDAGELVSLLAPKGIAPGIPLGAPGVGIAGMEKHLLMAVTDRTTPGHIETLARALEGVVG